MQPLLAASGADNGGRVVQPLESLALKSLEILADLNGRGIVALSVDDRRTLWDRELRTIILDPKTNHDLKCAIFARLNLGAMALNSQELRNCLYRGPYNRQIEQLSVEAPFLRLWKKNAPDKRMKHREYVLRFFASLHRRDRYQTPFRVFLNDEMEEHQHIGNEEQRRFRAEFHTAIEWTDRVFGAEALRLFRIGAEGSPPGSWGRNRNDLLYEVTMAGFREYGDQLKVVWSGLRSGERELFRDGVRRRLIDVMTDRAFTEALREGTTHATNYATRFRLWTQALTGIVDYPEPTLSITRELHSAWDAGVICGVCPSQVAMDDAVFSPNRKSIVHRFSRSRAA